VRRLGERLDALLDVPWELVEYERWCAKEGAPATEYLFSETQMRFEADNADVLALPEDWTLVDAKGGLELRSARLGGGVSLAGVKRGAALRVLGHIDGQRSLAELRVLAGADRPVLERVLGAAFGSVVFAPLALARLESDVSGVELVRFVGAPYELVRAYWANSGAVRRALEASSDEFSEPERALRALRRLHVILLLGDDLETFYRPQSRIASRGVQPGALYGAASRRVRAEGSTLLLGGPRVGVPLVGGERYHRALALAAGDPGALEPERALSDEDGLDWGGVVTGRALDDREDAAWFCPPRPLEGAHFAKLLGAFSAALEAARSPDAARVVGELARFHRRFVRLHPFRAANQSLAMNLVNAVLGRALGAGIPHLLLDQLALRLTETAYVAVFRLAVDGHLVAGKSEARWRTLAERKRRMYGVVERLARARDAEAEAILDADVEATRLALIQR